MTRAELKIGDWVSYEGKPFQIYDMTRQGDVVWFDEGATSVLMEDIKPIHLTEEILEKNGFVHHKDQEDDFWCIPNQYFGIDVKDGSLVWLNSKKILSVHQLQHILWALGMDDNLKL